jgi:hypothetical protein
LRAALTTEPDHGATKTAALKIKSLAWLTQILKQGTTTRAAEAAVMTTSATPRMASTPPLSTPHSYVAHGQAKKQYGEVLPNTIARHMSMKTVTNIKKGVHVNITWVSIYHICLPDQQAKLPISRDSTYNVYGIVSHGASGKRGWDVQFDIFPLDNDTVKSITRQKFVVLEEG